MILVDHCTPCFWQLGTSAGYVSQTAEAALWKRQPSGAFCFFSKWQPCCPPSLSTLFSSPSLLPIKMRNNSNVLLSTVLAIISLHNHLTLLCLCELLMPNGQRAIKSKAVLLLSAIDQQRQDKLLTWHSHVRRVKCWQASWVRVLIIMYNWKNAVQALCHACLMLAIASLWTTKQLKSRPWNLIAEATPPVPQKWLQHQPSDII